MSFWCTVSLYVPIERLALALRAVAGFAEPEEGIVEIHLPTGETVELPRLEEKGAASENLGCRSSLELASEGTFWFPIDEVILEEERRWYESQGLPLPIEEREGVECLPVANIAFGVTCGCRFAELSFTGQINSVSRALFGSESIADRFAALAEEVGAAAAVIRDLDRHHTIFTLSSDQIVFDWLPFDEASGDNVDALTEAICEALDTPLPPIVIAPSWLTWNGATVRRLAEAIKQDGDLSRLPILGDALEEAGCEDAFLLTHARAGLRHSSGSCRLIDLILGRKERD
jgi:hypothetical protein